ncbi:MAG: ABC transporter ATP-binding protein [Acidimicrobiia bacterium]|nr:ABC transporter ATP-binding protein [Acidimicrobiia bacterium]NNF64908.1 ABC transporter ATP-binding protein [Acidimicrobiia bacterium]
MADPIFVVDGLAVAARRSARDEVQDKRDAKHAEDDQWPDAPNSGESGPKSKWLELVPEVSFAVSSGEVLALVGESGSGKSLMLMGSIGLLPPGLHATAGTSVFNGQKLRRSEIGMDALAELRDPEWRSLVGMGIGVLFQDPIGSWNPVELIGDQSGEVLRTHEDLTDDEIAFRVLELLGDVQLSKKRKFLSFPEQLSRGEAQRAMLAAALLSEPKLLLADEPLTGLDVTVARGVLDVIDRLRSERGMAMIIVTHDLAVVAGVADRVSVVYAGQIVETAAATDLYRNPQHPYSDGLLGSMPGFGQRLRPIEGDAPDLAESWEGCAFAPRCNYAVDRCHSETPELRRVEASVVRCHRAEELDLIGIGRKT